MDEIDPLVERLCVTGPLSLRLEGWDQASIWGWDDSARSLYAHLWRNSDDPAQLPTIRIGPDDLTAVITIPENLAMRIAIAVDRSPWEVDTAMGGADEKEYGVMPAQRNIGGLP